MLTVAKVTQASAAGYADYLEGKTEPEELGDYYLKDGERVEAPGRWAAGAAAVGGDAGGPVSGDQLRALMAVRRPDTGGPLRKAGASGEAVAALDATFSAPKSVSAVWAVADPVLRLEVERAHEHAVDRALEHAVKRVAMVRERLDATTVIHAKPTSLIATSWRHTTARAVDGQLPDPQLHSHVLLHAAVRGDGRVVAIDSRSWLVHRREVGAAYRTELARELSRLGFEIQRGTGRGGRYFEIAGIPQQLLDRWSSRHQEVHVAIRERLADRERALRATIAAGGPDAIEAMQRLALLRQTRQLAPGEERLMATATRSAKTLVTHRDLDAHWQRTARHHQLDHPTVGRLREPRTPLTVASRRELLDGLTEFDATFPARDARAVALERSAGVPILDALEPLRELRQAEDILVLADKSGTTREHRGRERATVAIAERLAKERVQPVPAELVAREIQGLDRELSKGGGRLSSEQREAIELGCSGRPLIVIEGHAGTGKSTTLTAVGRAHQAAGREIIVTSTAAIAAERLSRELHEGGVDATAYSTAALGNAIADGRVQLCERTTIVHDEAALASTREQEQLLAAVQESGARLIEIGDPRQNQPVGAGGLWTDLQEVVQGADAYVQLTRNQRAQDPDDRRDQALFREGEHERALRGYAARDRVHLTGEQRDAEDLALDAAQADRAGGKRTIVIAQTSNDHLDQLNARAQAIRRQHGELGSESVAVPGRPYRMYAGEEIQIRRTITHPEHGQLRNGTTATITAVHADAGSLTLRLADGREVTLHREQTARADLRLAYVQHPFPAQGQTADTAHLIVAEHTTREGAYVALTRARQQTQIWAADCDQPGTETDRLAVLAEGIGREEPDLPSIHTPLAHQTPLTRQLDHTTNQPDHATLHPVGPDKAPVERESELDPAPAERRWPRSAERSVEPAAAERELRSRDQPRAGWEP